MMTGERKLTFKKALLRRDLLNGLEVTSLFSAYQSRFVESQSIEFKEGLCYPGQAMPLCCPLTAKIAVADNTHFCTIFAAVFLQVYCNCEVESGSRSWSCSVHQNRVAPLEPDLSETRQWVEFFGRVACKAIGLANSRLTDSRLLLQLSANLILQADTETDLVVKMKFPAAAEENKAAACIDDEVFVTVMPFS
jgi:hypothetical protein